MPIPRPRLPEGLPHSASEQTNVASPDNQFIMLPLLKLVGGTTIPIGFAMQSTPGLIAFVSRTRRDASWQPSNQHRVSRNEVLWRLMCSHKRQSL